MATPLGLPATTFDKADRSNVFALRSNYLGLTGTFNTTTVTAQAESAVGGTNPDGRGYSTHIKADEVLLIDKIVIRAMTSDASGDLIVTMKVNDNEMPFHFPSTVDLRHQKTLILEPRGNMVVQPGKSIYFKASVDNVATATVYYRKMTLAQALRTKQLPGTLPNVASTNTLTGSGTTAATAKKIIDCPAGYAIEVLGFYLTGHNYNSAADSLALGFWEGTGTFYTPAATKAATANMICVAQFRGASELFAPRIIVNDTKGCIQGPVGSSIYIQGSTNVAGSTPTADFVVMYRLVKPATRRKYFTSTATYSTSPVTSIVMTPSASLEIPTAGTITLTRHDGTVTTSTYTAYSGGTFTISTGTDFSGTGATGNLDAGATCYVEYYVRDVADPTGQLNQRLAAGKKFWVSTIAAATTYVDGNEALNRWFDTTSTNVGSSDYQKDSLIKIRGYVGSFLADRASLGSGTSGIVVGSSLNLHTPVIGTIPLNDANPNGTQVVTSRHIVEPDELALCNSSQVPGFLCIEIGSNTIPARFQLAWGEMSAFKDTTGFVTSFTGG